jgi:endonuclease/exonuclease/phosphatase (EEP) superfamily protein YafD
MSDEARRDTLAARSGTRFLIPGGGIFIAWLIGQVCRDRWFLAGLCFYLPSPLVAGVLLTIGLFATWRRCRRVALVASLLALGPIAVTALVENRWRTPHTPQATREMRLMHWNVFYGSLGWSGIRSQLRETNADFYLLSEVPKNQPLEIFLDDLGPDFAGVRMASMAVLARGEIHAEPIPTSSGRVTAFRVAWKHRARELSVLAIDLPSSPAIARDPLLREVRATIAANSPDIIVGDFNAPRRSAVLSDLPEGYCHAYDSAGSGWSYSWPVPAPMWAIDQCILGPRIVPLGYELRSTAASDHRLQLLCFDCRD